MSPHVAPSPSCQWTEASNFGSAQSSDRAGCTVLIILQVMKSSEGVYPSVTSDIK